VPSTLDAPVTAWWGDGAPPAERWPGVTIPVDDVGGRYRFDPALADRACDWFPRFCSHAKGAHAGARFDLLDYQRALILRPIFGWVREDGTRRFRKAYIEIPKKNGKTQLVAGLALYMLLGDREPGAEVYVAAADREQARILFDAAKLMVDANPQLKKRLIVLRNEIRRVDDPSAVFKVLSAEAATKHGPNIHCLIIDELHAQPDRELFETLTRGVIARRQPLILLITTAGDDDESICPAFATDLATKLRDSAGLNILEVLQNYKMLSEPAQVIEALIKGQRFAHDGHRLYRWNWQNAAVKTDDAGRIRPVKPKRASKRIDGAVATIMGDKALSMNPAPPSFQMFFAGGRK
jgi:phage terminase large subunit-like protein